MTDTQKAAMEQALEALEILRSGLIQMREHAESYGEAWARAYVKEYRDLLPGSAEEQFRVLNAMQHRLADVADGVVKGFDAITALRAALAEQPAEQEPVAWPKADDSAKELGWSWDYKWLESLADATRAAGWDTSMEAIDFVLSRVAAPQAPPVEWFVQWIRNNYQNHPNIASLCDAMREAAHGIAKE